MAIKWGYEMAKILCGPGPLVFMSASEHERRIKESDIEEFQALGSWVNEKSIGDYPVMGSSLVSPLHVFQQFVKESEESGEKDLPGIVLETIRNLKRIGYDENVLVESLIHATIELNYDTNFIRDTRVISSTSNTKEEFDSRFKMLAQARDLRSKALREPSSTFKGSKR